MTRKTKTDSTDKVDIFMPIFIGDYLKDTTFLTTEQHGAYILMLFACWQHGSIPDSDQVIRRITGLDKDAWSESKDVLMAYFKIQDGAIHHSRIDRELISARRKKKSMSTRGKSGADARWGNKKNATSNATSNGTSINQAMLKQCPSPSPSHKKNITPVTQRDLEFLERFNKLLNRKFRTMAGKASSQLTARLKEGYTVDEILDAAKACSTSDYHVKNRHYLTPEFITRSDKMLLYSQLAETPTTWIRYSATPTGVDVNADGKTHKQWLEENK